MIKIEYEVLPKLSQWLVIKLTKYCDYQGGLLNVEEQAIRNFPSEDEAEEFAHKCRMRDH